MWGLADCESVQGEDVADLLVVLPVLPERERDVPLDRGSAWKDPQWVQIAGARGAGGICRGIERRLPLVASSWPKGIGAVGSNGRERDPHCRGIPPIVTVRIPTPQ